MRKNNYRKIGAALLAASLMMAGCASSSSEQGTSAASKESSSVSESVSDASTEAETVAETEPDAVAAEVEAIKSWSTIKLLDNASSTSDTTVKIGDNNKVTIQEGGNYVITGKLTEGVLSVKTTDENAKVVIKLAGVTISNSEKTALKIKSAGNVIIYLEDGTENVITSGKETVIKELVDEDASESEDAATGGAINSSCDLTICGPGSLSSYGYLKMGIHSKGVLKITGGKIDVKAIANGIKGNNGVEISGGSISILSGNDAIKTESSSNPYSDINISGGKIDINAFGDGMQATGKITISGGVTDIKQSKEGLEAPNILINDGQLSIRSEDDGINASKTSKDGANTMIFNGGKVYVNAGGDGLDSNGDLIVTGGELQIAGPTKGKSGALDNGNENGGVLLISGGTVIAIGSTGNDKVFSESSSQCAFEVHLNFSEGDVITVSGSDGTVLYTFEAIKTGSSIVFSSPELKKGETYTVSAGSNKKEITLTEMVVTDN
ncbi:MAG: carbohydrate-binding domain-containing protein [Lachnospiraceae bacterium]|nr:carbohydrate-binding domain-containing protein [Lachnospiraceae bacterium]